MNNNKQSSSVEWLDNEFASLYFDYLTGLIDNKEFNERHKAILEQAKEKEKEKIIDAYNQGCLDALKDEMKRGKQYYNQTFGE